MTRYCNHQTENSISVSSACMLAHPPFLSVLLFILQLCLTFSQKERVLLILGLIFNENFTLNASEFLP